jgi:hypothetical protein
MKARALATGKKKYNWARAEEILLEAYRKMLDRERGVVT